MLTIDIYLEEMKRSLKDPSDIMFVHWSTAARHFVGTNYYDYEQVYKYGWEHNNQTRHIRTLFQDYLNPVANLTREDFL